MKTTHCEFTSQLLQAQKSLRSFALKLTANPSDASDLVQDTTLKALHARESFGEKNNFSGWIMTIMRNTFLNSRRSAAHTTNILDQTVDCDQLATLSIQSDTPTPDSVYSANQISRIIASLPETQRVPFTMFMEGYRYAEIAQHLNLPLNLIKSRILNARRALQTKLSKN